MKIDSDSILYQEQESKDQESSRYCRSCLEEIPEARVEKCEKDHHICHCRDICQIHHRIHSQSTISFSCADYSSVSPNPFQIPTAQPLRKCLLHKSRCVPGEWR